MRDHKHFKGPLPVFNLVLTEEMKEIMDKNTPVEAYAKGLLDPEKVQAVEVDLSGFNVSRNVNYESAKHYGYEGTPDRWERVKHKYATDMLEKFGPDHRIDFNNLLIGTDNWFEFPPEHQLES